VSCYGFEIRVGVLNVCSWLGFSFLHSFDVFRCREKMTFRFDAIDSHIRIARNMVAVRETIDPIEEILFHVVNVSG
jgi:hypothetical protein